MNKLLSAALACGAALASVPVAAAPFMTPIVTGSASFGDNDLNCNATGIAPCAFTDTLTFTTPTGYNLASATLSSAMVGTDATTNVDFTSVTLNGVDFTNVISGTTEFRQILSQALTVGATNTLSISGLTGGNGSFGGSLVFAAASAVPEPATWGMMILGMGAVGFALRRREKVARGYAA